MSCLLDKETQDELFSLIATNMFNKPKGEPLLLDDYIKEIYDFVEESSEGNKALALDAARLVPVLLEKLFAVRPKLLEKFEETNEDIKFDIGRKEKAFRKEGLDKVREVLKLNTDVAADIDAAKIELEVAPVEVEQTPTVEEQEAKALPWVALPLGAMYTHASELINWEDAQANDYLAMNLYERLNFIAIRAIQKLLSDANVTDSSELRIDGIGPVFFKVFPAAEANALAGKTGKLLENKGMVALLVDEGGKVLSVDQNGNIIRKAKNVQAVSFKLYSTVLFKTVNGEKVLNIEDKKAFIDHVKNSAEFSTMGGFKDKNAKNFYNTILAKYNKIVNNKIDNGMAEEQAKAEALAELTADFMMLERMREHVESNGKTVKAVITRGAKGFLIRNQYKPNPLSDVVFPEGSSFKPEQISKDQLGVTQEEGYAYFSYPGVSDPVAINKPALNRTKVVDTIISLFTEVLTENGKPVDAIRRNELIEQFMLGQYSGIQFIVEKGTTNLTHTGGYNRVVVLGTGFNITFDEAGAEERTKLAEALKKAFNTGVKGEQIVNLTTENLTKEGAKPTKSLQGVTIKPDMVLEKDGLYYRINTPHLELVGALLNSTYDHPTITDGVLVTEEQNYNDFVKDNFEVISPIFNGKLVEINPTLSFAPEVQELTEFMPTEEVKKEVEESQKPKEKSTSNDPATQPDEDLDADLMNIKLNKGRSQKSQNKTVTEEQVQAAKEWYEKSPLAAHFPFEIWMSAVNENHGPVAQWAIDGIKLFHYYSEGGKFDASKSGDFTDLYHEAWHGFTQTFLTEEKRTALYNEVRKREGSFKDYEGNYTTFAGAGVWQLEEFLAEEFREFMISGGKKVIKGSPVQRSIFKQILDFLKAFFGKTKAGEVIQNPMSFGPVFEMYNNLRLGDLSTYNFDVNNRDKTIGVLNSLRGVNPKDDSKISFADADMLTRSIDSMISQLAYAMSNVRNDRALITELMLDPKLKKSAYARALQEFVAKKNKFQAEYDALAAEPESSSNTYNKGQLAQRIKLLTWAVDNFGDINNLSNNKGKNGLIAYHVEKSSYLSESDKESIFDDTDIDETKQNVEASEKFGERGNEKSQYEQSSTAVKYLLRSIHKYDEKGAPVRNMLDVHELSDTHIVWNKLARILSNISSRPAMYAALYEAAKSDPTIKEVLDRLGPIETTTADDTALWQNFWATFNMAEIPLMQVTVKSKTGEPFEANGVMYDNISYEMTIGQANSNSFRTVNIWKNNFRLLNSDYIIRDNRNELTDGKPNPDFNSNYLDVDALLKDFTNAKGAFIDNKAVEFFKAIGVSLSDKTAINDAIKKNVGNPKIIFNRLKTLSENGIKNIYSLDDIFREYKEFKLSSDNANLSALGDLENKHSDHTSNYAQTNAEGNMQYELSLHNSMSIMIGSINDAVDYQALIDMPHMAHLDISKNPQAASSIWLNSIFTLRDAKGNPITDSTFGTKRMTNGVAAKINLSNLSGIQMVSEKGSDGIASANADEFSKMIMDFHLTLAGRPELMRHADKGTSFSVWIQNMFGVGKTNYVDSEDFLQRPDGVAGYRQASTIMVNYLNAELERISKLKALKAESKKGKVVYDAHYLEKGQEFVVFQDILTKSTLKSLKDISSTKEISPDLLDTIKAEIEEYLNDQFLKVKTVFNENSFVDPALLSGLKAKAALGVNTENKNLKDALIRSFVVNNWINNIESMNLIYGDIAQYNMAKEEFHKRNAGVGSTGNMFTVDAPMINYINKQGRKYAASQGIKEKQMSVDGSFQSAIMKDSNLPSDYLPEITEAIRENITARYKNKPQTPELTALIEEKVAKAVNAYTGMEEGDGQGWITFDFYRAASIMEGKWSKKQESMYNDIVNGEPISPEDAAEFFPTKKYQYWGPVENRERDPKTGEFLKDKSGYIPTNAFHKFSLFPLIPTVIQGTNLENLHTKMMNQGVDYSLFKSGSKISTLTKIGEDGKAVPDLFYKEGRDFDTESDFTPNTIYFQFLKNQLEIAPKFKGKVTFPTQMRKLIENGLMEGGVPTDFKSDLSLKSRQVEWNKLKDDAARIKASPYFGLIKAFEDDIAALTEIKKAALIKEADIQFEVDAKGNKKVKINTKFIEFIQGELSRQELGEHEVAFLKTKSGGAGLAHDLSLSLSSEKIEKILNAIVVKRLVKQKFKGEGLIQVSGAGFEKNLRGNLSAEEKLKYGTNELPFYTREVVSIDKDGNKVYGKTMAMKVKIAMQGDFEKLLFLKDKNGNTIGTLDNLNKLLQDEEWLNTGDHRQMVSITGPRIPTQETNSMEFAEVYEFLPKQAGNIVILPSEIVAKSGGDFDIDKITFMMPNIKSEPSVKDIDFDVFAESYNSTAEKMKKLFEERSKPDKTDEEKAILEDMFNYAPKNITIPMDKDTEKGLENRILKDMTNILQLKNSYASLVRPNDTDLIKPLADKLADKVMKYKPKSRFRDNDKHNTIAGTRVFEIQYNLYKHASNNIGKATLGLGAVDNTYNTVYNRVGARMNYEYETSNSTLKNPDFKRLDILLPHNTVLDEQGRDVISLSHLNDITGETSISSVIAQLINGWVDIAKDAWVFNIQANKEISPTLLFMVQAGVPVEQAVYMVSHPLIRKYVEEQKLAKSTFAEALGKGDKKNPNLYRNAARKEIFKLLFTNAEVKELAGNNKERDEALKGLTETLYNNPEVKDFFSQDQVTEGDFKGKMKVEENLFNKVDKTSGKYDAIDKAVFLHFLELEEMSKVNTKVKMNTNFDTSRSNNLFEAQRKIDLFSDLRAEQMIPSDLAENIRQNSPIGSFFVQDFQLELWKDLFELRSNDTFNDFISEKMGDMSEFMDMSDATFGDTEKVINEFRNDLPSFIFQNSIRNFTVTDKSVYKGLDVNTEGSEIKKVTSLRHGVWVKNVNGKAVIFMDKQQLERDYVALASKQYNYSITLEDGTMVSLAPVKSVDFPTPETYYAFVMEREVLRNRWSDKFDVLKERADVQAKFKTYPESVPRLENETDKHFEARLNSIIFEETIRNMALDNTFNSAKMFTSVDSMAAELAQIQQLYPELASKYSLVDTLSSVITGKEGSRMANIKLNDSMVDDPNKINIYHQNLLNLSNPGKIEINTTSAVEKERVADFFNRLSLFAFLQSGMNTKGMYSLIRLVPQEKFTELMSIYAPEFLSNVNAVTLERYWRQFKVVNSNRGTRAKMRDYTITKYNPAADYKLSQGNRLTAAMAKDVLKGKVEKVDEDGQTKVEKITEVVFSEDNQGNPLFNAAGVKISGARLALDAKPKDLFIVNGSENGATVTGMGEDALYSLRKTHKNIIGLPTRKSMSSGAQGQLTDGDVYPDGTVATHTTAKTNPVPAPSIPITATRSLITVESLKGKGTFRTKPVEFVDIIPTTKTTPVAARNDKETGKVYMVEKLMREKFAQKSWTKSAVQKDGSQATPLAADEFKTFNEFLTFVLIHEVKHDTILREQDEKTGAYEDRINQAALADLRENYINESTSVKANVILPIGTSGSGKSTFIKSLPQENLVVISPDNMRVEFTGDINNKSKDKEIYIEAANRAIKAVKEGKQVVFDTTNLTKEKRKPFIEAIKKALPNVNIQYKLMPLDAELAKQRIKAQIARGENRANVSDETIDRHAESYKQMLEDIKSEGITNYETTQPSTSTSIASVGKTDEKGDSKTLRPIATTKINPALKTQIDATITSMLEFKEQGYTLNFPSAGFGQYMIGADDNTGLLKDGKIVPVSPAAFVYLSQQLWDKFKFANPNFDLALGYTNQVNVLQVNAEVSDVDVAEGLSFCFKGAM